MWRLAKRRPTPIWFAGPYGVATGGGRSLGVPQKTSGAGFTEGSARRLWDSGRFSGSCQSLHQLFAQTPRKL
jgi:hypothetical protein